MDKSVLMDYIDACELIKETEEDIQKMRRRETVSDIVTGSNPEFPYQPKRFHLSGIVETSLDEEQLEKERRLLLQRKEYAGQVKLRAEEIMNTATARMQRIIRLRVFQRKTWEEVSIKLGGRCTGDSVRMEFQRFLEEK